MKKTFISIIIISLLTIINAQGITNTLGTSNSSTNFNVRSSNNNLLLRIQGDGGALFLGTFDTGSIPRSGAGARMMWYPKKAAFRVGYATGTQWDDGNIGKYSTAMGRDTKASGKFSTAMGDGTRASGDYSTAMGASTTASGAFSTAMNINTIASGNYSTAMGASTTASAEYSTAMGFVTTASGRRSTAMGSGTIASGVASTAMGSGTIASGVASTVMGSEIEASGEYSVAIALNNQDGTKVTQNNTMAIMGGKVGIDTKSPACKLHVRQAGYGKNNGLRLESPDGDYWNMQTNSYNDFVIWYNGSAGTRAWISKTDASYQNASDRRLKQNINIIENALDKVMLLKPVTYELKSNPNSKHQSYGFIAQEVEEVYPEFVSENEGMKGLAYRNFGVLAIKAIQEQQEQIKELKVENVLLKQRLEAVENKLN